MELLIASRSIFRLSVSINLTATSGIIRKSSINACKYFGTRDFSWSSPRLKLPGGQIRSQISVNTNLKDPTPLDELKRLYKAFKHIPKLGPILMKEFKLWKKELMDTFEKSPFPTTGKGEIDMLFTFEEDADLDRFLVVTDKSSNQGYSTATLVRTQNETVVFSGFIDTRLPNDGKTTNAGFASILSNRLKKSFKRVDKYDLTNYTHLVLKVRGDGRTYNIVLGCRQELSPGFMDQFHYPLFTRGGPYWQIAKIPLSNFIFTSRGRIQDTPEVMPHDACSRMALTLDDGQSGPFRIEIEYFGLEFQPYHKNICPYEEYFGKMIAYP